MDEEEQHKTWQALIDLFENMNTTLMAVERRTSVLNAVVRAVLMEWPKAQRPALAAEIRRIATMRDDLAVQTTVTDEARDEYLKEVELFAGLLD